METSNSSVGTDDWVEKVWFPSYLKAQEDRMIKEKIKEKNNENSESL